jgi:subtilisin family serine protease
LPRFVGRAVAVLAVLCCSALQAQTREVVATHCLESEVRLDSTHTAALLGNCSDGGGEDLLWHLDRLDQPNGSLDGRFVRHSRGTGVVVYVMDTGVMASHDEFATAGGSRVVAGFDTAQSVVVGGSNCHSTNKALAPCFSDFNELTPASHGTAVASLIAGRRVGVAPDAKIVSLRVMNERGLATTRTYIDALNAIVAHAWTTNDSAYNTSIINISGWVLDHLSSNDAYDAVPYATVEKKIRDMVFGVNANGQRDVHGRRFLFVVAGNNVDGGCGAAGTVDRFPAILGRNIDGLITVGGMTEENEAWGGSCKGGLEVLAPAQSIFSASITAKDHYRSRNMRCGTSFSAPIIAGVAALLLEEHPDFTPDQLEAAIESTPSRIAHPDTRVADGRVAYTFSGDPAARALLQQQVRLAP